MFTWTMNKKNRITVAISLAALLTCGLPTLAGGSSGNEPDAKAVATNSLQGEEKPPLTSVEERRLLLALQQERQNLAREREDLARRKKDLKRLEAEVDKKLAQLEATRRKLEELLKEKDAIERKRIKDLAKMYAKMSPERAAAVFSDLKQDLVVEIINEMKAKSAARILNNMDRDKAAAITAAFSSLR